MWTTKTLNPNILGWKLNKKLFWNVGYLGAAQEHKHIFGTSCSRDSYIYNWGDQILCYWKNVPTRYWTFISNFRTSQALWRASCRVVFDKEIHLTAKSPYSFHDPSVKQKTCCVVKCTASQNPFPAQSMTMYYLHHSWPVTGRFTPVRHININYDYKPFIDPMATDAPACSSDVLLTKLKEWRYLLSVQLQQLKIIAIWYFELLGFLQIVR